MKQSLNALGGAPKMRYTVDEKQSKQTGKKKLSFEVGLWGPDRSKWIVIPVEQDDFDRLNVGDVVEILISIAL
jgi:hypothetical protein